MEQLILETEPRCSLFMSIHMIISIFQTLLKVEPNREACESLDPVLELHLILRIIFGQEPVLDLSQEPVYGPLVEMCGTHGWWLSRTKNGLNLT